jgi:hypothetical protein
VSTCRDAARAKRRSIDRSHVSKPSHERREWGEVMASKGIYLADLALDEFGRAVLPEDLLDTIETEAAELSAGGTNIQCGCGTANQGCTNSYCPGSMNGGCTNQVYCEGSSNTRFCLGEPEG